MLQHFYQSVVDARRAGDENSDYSVVTETMKLLGNSYYGHQIMDRKRHTETKYLNDENTPKAINGRRFKCSNNASETFYEVEFSRSKIEHREPIMDGLFILQYAKLRMLEHCYNYFDKFCDVDKFQELKMDTDSLYLALAFEKLYNCIRPAKMEEWETL